ncbi:hypothetical protein J6R97_03120 [bacterium]|nr:hypothetical protein [bacterium]
MSILINSVSVNDKNVGNPPSKNVVKKDPKADISQSLFDNKIVEDIRDYRLNKQFEKYPGIKLLMSNLPSDEEYLQYNLKKLIESLAMSSAQEEKFYNILKELEAIFSGSESKKELNQLYKLTQDLEAILKIK